MVLKYMTVVIQVAEQALGDFLAEILFGVVLILAFLVKGRYEIKQEISLIKAELAMDEEKTRLEEHEEELQDIREAVEQFQQTADRLEMHFVGDENDPSKRGLLQEMHDVKSDLKTIKLALKQDDSIEVEEYDTNDSD
jgi:FtsZ-interacting cell division protein ZipA